MHLWKSEQGSVTERQHIKFLAHKWRSEMGLIHVPYVNDMML